MFSFSRARRRRNFEKVKEPSGKIIPSYPLVSSNDLRHLWIDADVWKQGEEFFNWEHLLTDIINELKSRQIFDMKVTMKGIVISASSGSSVISAKTPPDSHTCTDSTQVNEAYLYISLNKGDPGAESAMTTALNTIKTKFNGYNSKDTEFRVFYNSPEQVF